MSYTSKHTWFLIVAVIFLLVSACQNDGTAKNHENSLSNNTDSGTLKGPVIEFDTTSYDFGRVYEGEMVGWYFKYKNSGDKNLLLLSVTAGCGCTIPGYSKEPLPPGQTGEIKVIFDSSGRSGTQYKTVSVESNAEPRNIQLVITADVIKK